MATVVDFVVKSSKNVCTSAKVSVNRAEANPSLALFTYFSFVKSSSLTLKCKC